MRRQSNSLKTDGKEEIQMWLGFDIKLLFFFFFLILYESSKHLQDTLLTKLLGQFIGLHSTQFFKILATLT